MRKSNGAREKNTNMAVASSVSARLSHADKAYISCIRAKVRLQPGQCHAMQSRIYPLVPLFQGTSAT